MYLGLNKKIITAFLQKPMTEGQLITKTEGSPLGAKSLSCSSGNTSPEAMKKQGKFKIPRWVGLLIPHQSLTIKLINNF